MSLTPGERVVRCLKGEPTDRTPFGVGIGWWPWGQTMERWQKESGCPTLNLQETLGYDASFAMPAVQYGVWPLFEPVTIEETAEFITVRNERGITTKNRRDGMSMPQFLGYPVQTADDWARLKTERLNPQTPERMEQNGSKFRAQIKASGEAVQVGTYPYGVFGTPRDLLGAEELLVSFYDQPEMVRDMMNHLTSLWISLWEKVANEVQIDHIHIWEDMSGRQGSLISPAMVREFMMPCYDRIAQFARGANVRLISVDTDGDCSALVPIMQAHGVNVFFPFEVQAGNDILQYRRQYPELGMLGGLDKRSLALSKAAIDREVAKTQAMLRKGRYIPGFDHLIPPDVPWENFKYAAERIKACCLE